VQHKKRSAGVWIAAALVGAAACEVRDAREPPALWTLFELEAAMATNAPVARSRAFPGGLPASMFLERTEDGALVPRVRPAFCEGEPAAYVVPELWANYDEVWVQPWYALLTAWNEKSPGQNRLKDAAGKNTPPLYDVDTASTFYSPFWKVLYVEVPPGTTPETYTSTKQFFDQRLPIHEGPLWIYSMRPPSITLGKPMHPLMGMEVGNMSLGDAAIVEGRRVPYLNLGANNFRADAALVVEEVPLFWPARRLPDGGREVLDAPAVIGTGPLGSRRAPDVVGNRPRFGGLCRVYLAFLPQTAATFEPGAQPDASAKLADASKDPNAWAGRLAMNAVKVGMNDTECFTADAFPASCTWLDSQARIEERLGEANLERTEVTMTCPFVFYAGKAVR
jgi:hypothetical protein